MIYNLKFIKSMINVDLDYADFEGILPMHYAVLFGNIPTIKFLVDKGVEVNKHLEGIPILQLSLSFAGNIYLI